MVAMALTIKKPWKPRGTLIVFFALLFFSTAEYSAGSSMYTYYGYVPSRIWMATPVKGWLSGVPIGDEWEIVSSTISDFAFLMIVACRDETEVTVYRLPNREVLRAAKLKMMEKLFVRLPNGTFFKVVSNKPLSVTLLGGKKGGQDLDPASPFSFVPNSFYPSVDGGFVGKEFIFIASQDPIGAPYRILALEPSEVVIEDENGSTVHRFQLAPGEFKELGLRAFSAYRITSTGSIMVHTTGRGCLPSIEGSYVGRHFVSSSATSWWPSRDRSPSSFRIMALEETNVEIYDLEFKKKIAGFRIAAGHIAAVKPPAKEILIKSEKPLSVMFVGNDGTYGYGSGMTFMGIGAGQTALVYVPVEPLTQRAFIFSSEETVVTIDDATFRLAADEIFPLSPGLHKITPSRNILIQIIYWSGHVPFQGISTFSALIPAVEAVNAKSEVDAASLLAGGPSLGTYIMYFLAATAAISAAMIIHLLTKKRRAGGALRGEFS
jgi:hypothetical protein